MKLSLPFKSRKYRLEFYRWYQVQLFTGRHGRKPTEGELEKQLSEECFQYNEDVAKNEMLQIQISLPIFERELRPKFTTNLNPTDFPIRFKECLRRIIGGRSYGYNLPIFKDFYRHYLKSISVKSNRPAHEQTDEYIAQQVLDFIEWFKKEKIDDGFFTLFAREIPIWRKAHRMKPQRRNAANSRWLKENRRKFLALLILRKNELSHRNKALKVKVRSKKMSTSHRKKPRK